MNTEDLAQRKVLSFKVASFLFLHLECVMERCGQLFQGPVQEVCLDFISLWDTSMSRQSLMFAPFP